ncbi:amidase family protein [Aaosphaeria arxii CBS 175.79]|uniref:Amidase family protein n=1 Tax=Aaosphaeria arxii CBS 175.79 TaxID=1450172 RepID=A0A6A5XXA4_9PLEO|nr:amidase family protein [Aaosphaeria arxii CBS 175.79]KAF2017351.1 amidase family protein [Aaosphaeria arxii CBS 175.79]
MARMWFWLSLALASLSAQAAPIVKRNPYTFVLDNPYGDAIFQLGEIAYLANTKYPKAVIAADCQTVTSAIPITVIKTNASSITKDTLTSVIDSYLSADDVFNHDFLDGLYISSAVKTSLDATAVEYLTSLNTTFVFADSTVSVEGSFTTIALESPAEVPIGPYLAHVESGTVSFSTVYRLYPDTYRTFLFGAYDANDGEDNHNPLGTFLPKFWDPMIPVPSRVYSWGDERPLAGERVAIKDLYDVKGLQTSGGSQAWAYITPVSNGTAPSVQKILDLGGIVVGKQKLAQFASGANPWEWQDEHYPFNPRGDGWLTCSASSSGGGCSVAAYDWLDYAIGSDTGSSMRRPAAVSGTYGQRPSQGLMSLERVLPLGGATDTAGVFSRDPYKWIKFSKAWYSPDLYQDSSITGLSPLEVPDTDAFPKTILYPVDYLPLNNSAAEPILQEFIASMSRIFNMTVKELNFTATVQNFSDPIASNFTTLSAATGVINTWSAWEVIGKPLITAWGALFDGRFPPIDPARRPGWKAFNETRTNQVAYDAALVTKNRGVEWYEKELQYSTPESCSESIMLYDIGTGGLPSFRERELNESPDASYLAVLPKTAKITGANICPIFGCADFTVPIGQVPYQSNITFHEEMVPVTINLVVKRGCDFMLYNMIERLADEGVLKTVKTGRTAF